MSKPIVAVVGRPNVGKSTLFNKLCGQRLAIVEDTPGITRDRIFANCEWNGHEFLLVDTGGIEPKATEGILAHMREQAQIAIDTADCIIMVTDVRNGLTAADEDVAHMLRRSHKPIILAVNKCDKVGEAPMELYEFYNLGFDEVMPISSVHGHGTGDLLDAVCAHLDFSETVVEEDRIPVAIIGRPNVGKSSLTNRILGENRMIVANEAGTTRDAIDTPVDNAYGKFIFTDTAGLRKRSNISDGLERYMVVRALAAVERSRVALILVDATVGFTEQDSKVAGYAHEQGKACIIVVNKWDAVEKDGKTLPMPRRMEGFVTHLADHDWVLSVPAAQWTVDALKQVAVRSYGIKEADLTKKPFNQFRNYVLSQKTAMQLYGAYSTKGLDGLTAEVAEIVRA